MHSIAWWPSVIVLGSAAVIDMFSRRIPNWLAVPYLVAGLAARAMDGGMAGLRMSLAGMAVAAALFGVQGLLGGMGMGDVKLALGVGAWIGPGQLLIAFILTGIAGGLHAILYGWWRGPEAHSIPYAPAIAIGAWMSFFTQSAGLR